jgi:succinate dehydrogenase / fumarate reductase flavoprotein subunit
MRLAAKAGCRLRDMELVQFHPTAMVFPEESAGTLVTEAVRGEGGILRNAVGERFMERHDPERLELSTRDRVALAIYPEISEGRGTDDGGVLLDVSHLGRDVVLGWLPRMYRRFVDLAMLDITRVPMEVAPRAHYSMGGVRVEPETYLTDVEALYAVGECATGVHGAIDSAATRSRSVSSSAGSSAARRPAARRRSTCRCATAARSPPQAKRSTSCSHVVAISSPVRSSAPCAT